MPKGNSPHIAKEGGDSFSLKRVLAVTGRILQQIRRDKRTLAMMLIMPSIIIFIFGLAFSGEVKNIPIALDNSDTGYSFLAGPGNRQTIDLGDKLCDALIDDDRVKVNLVTFREGRSGVDHGTYYVAIKIPGNFSECASKLSMGSDTSLVLDLYLDGTKPAVRVSALAALQESISEALDSKRSNLLIKQEFAFGGEEYNALDVSIPSLMGFVLSFLVMMISSIILMREKLGGTLYRLYVTPLTSLERLTGYMIALLILSSMMAGALLVVGIGVYGATVRGNVLLLASVTVLISSTNVFITIFLSNFARNELQAIQMVSILNFPSMALSGTLVPVSSLPEIAQPISRLIPLYWGNRLFEGIMLKGYGVGQLWFELMIILGVSAIFFVLALLTVKDKIVE